MIDFEIKKETRSRKVTEGLLITLLGIMISVFMFNTIFTTTGNIMIFAQSITNTTESNVTQVAEETANQTGTSASKTTSGALTAINETGQFVGNVSETVVENPVVANATGETQEFFADKSK
jgi:uncharacterized iron-regulated membrane protein